MASNISCLNVYVVTFVFFSLQPMECSWKFHLAFTLNRLPTPHHRGTENSISQPTAEFYRHTGGWAAVWVVFMGVDVTRCAMEGTDSSTAENLTEFSHSLSSCPEKLHQCHCKSCSYRPSGWEIEHKFSIPQCCQSALSVLHFHVLINCT